MIIKKIKLENIRSYVSQELELPEGSVLLSGDIGSGKSTVLLAIDFALFGIRKPDLTGASLLRNGTNSGSVEMQFEIEGKDVIIKRTLKRTQLGVSQDSGFIIIDRQKREGTAVELKQHILNLLNYPKELLTKSKSLIYKYTVYTPQEEMKHILTEEQDLRLDTLRKVFGIDKYKRVKENTKILISAIKGKKENLKGLTQDLDQKKDEIKQEKERLKEQDEKLEVLKPQLETVKKEFETKKKDIEKTETLIEKLRETRKQLEIRISEQKNLEEQKVEVEEELKALILQIAKAEKEVKKEQTKNIETEIRQKQEIIRQLEKETQEILNIIASLKTKQEEAEDLKNRITSLENCPTCKQQVSEEHKRSIKEEEDNKITAITKKLSLTEKNYKEKQQLLTKSKEELEHLKETRSQIEINNLKIQNLEEKKKKKEKLESQQKLFEKKASEIKNDILTFEKENRNYINVEEDYKQKKIELENILEKRSDLAQEEALVKNDIRNINKTVTELRIEVECKERSKKELIKLAQLQEWIDKNFISLMEVMEKNIMLKVHNDFDSLFQKWFNMIVEPGALQSKIDTTFTPLIEQNGHDIDYMFLSGGEKTATALAYRLALNQVINKLMRNIKTSDLLILDEPTDGFSNEQLDRVKEVIEDLDLKQIIIVSHEPKVESFVDNIVKFKKENHVSQAI